MQSSPLRGEAGSAFDRAQLALSETTRSAAQRLGIDIMPFQARRPSDDDIHRTEVIYLILSPLAGLDHLELSLMNSPNNNSYCEPLISQVLWSVEKKDFSWFFMFTGDISIATESSWRLLNDDGIVVTSEDHGHQFGLPAPVDAAQRVLSAVLGKPVVAASIIRPTSDLSVDFEYTSLQFLQMSCGYESWRLSIRDNLTICLGAGDIAYFSRPG